MIGQLLHALTCLIGDDEDDIRQQVREARRDPECPPEEADALEEAVEIFLAYRHIETLDIGDEVSIRGERYRVVGYVVMEGDTELTYCVANAQGEKSWMSLDGVVGLQ